MKYFYTLLTACLGGALLLPSSIAAEFAERGKIDALYLKSGYVIIDDSKYPLSGNVKVYAKDGQVTSLNSLQRGMGVAFNVEKQSVGRDWRNTITEMAILSSKK